MAKEIVHEDFGEKIGGAKKDLWAARGLYVDDLLGMNEREADKYVKKDNVWKKPDYNALIQSGVPVDILYFRKVVRDSLNASPRYLRSDDTPEKRLARQKEYIATVRQVQEAVEKVQTVQPVSDYDNPPGGSRGGWNVIIFFTAWRMGGDAVAKG